MAVQACWRKQLTYDPTAPLLASGDEALVWHVRRDLLDESVPPPGRLWQLPQAQKVLRGQQADGSFPYPGRRVDCWPPHHYPLVETWKRFRVLVDQYACTRKHPAVASAAEFLLACQTAEGDIRGFLANQYAPYYTGAILGLLIRAGYGRDPRIERGLRWLLDMRQDDGGWTVPLLTAKLNRKETHRLTSTRAAPIEPDRRQPFSHNWTGMVLRGFAVHPRLRRLSAVRRAADLLKTRFFQRDCYGSYQSADYWVRFQYPFWWNHLVAALDSLSVIGVPRADPDIDRALRWLIDHQQPDGLWLLDYASGRPTSDTPRVVETRRWVSLAICRVLKRYEP